MFKITYSYKYLLLIKKYIKLYPLRLIKKININGITVKLKYKFKIKYNL